MDLLEVHSIAKTHLDGIYNFDLTALIRPYGIIRVLFTYMPEDNDGLNGDVTAWWMNNPDFPINEAPNEIPQEVD